MNRTRPCLLLLAAVFFPSPAFSVSFDWVTVGNPGNSADPETGFGSVGYKYRISKHEVTNAQYVEYLNTVDPTGANSLGLYDPDMAGNFGGIENTGASDGGRYVAQAGRENNPFSFSDFFDAMRFTNWLHNGQGSGGTETGVYSIGNGRDEVRSEDASYWIPDEDEWYKAAYHDASAGTAGIYFDYATGSDSAPASDQPSDDPGAANYYNNDNIANGFNDGFAVNGSLTYPDTTNPYTDVGAYTDAASPYGTFDQNGNVLEWVEKLSREFTSLPRVLRGGAFNGESQDLRATGRAFKAPFGRIGNLGFRVASRVPTPTAASLAALACVGASSRRRR